MDETAAKPLPNPVPPVTVIIPPDGMRHADYVRLEKADLVHSTETDARKVVTAATPGKPAHDDVPPAPGPARLPERGMAANNADGGAGMMAGDGAQRTS